MRSVLGNAHHATKYLVWLLLHLHCIWLNIWLWTVLRNLFLWRVLLSMICFCVPVWCDAFGIQMSNLCVHVSCFYGHSLTWDSVSPRTCAFDWLWWCYSSATSRDAWVMAKCRMQTDAWDLNLYSNTRPGTFLAVASWRWFPFWILNILSAILTIWSAL